MKHIKYLWFGLVVVLGYAAVIAVVIAEIFCFMAGLTDDKARWLLVIPAATLMVPLCHWCGREHCEGEKAKQQDKQSEAMEKRLREY